MEILLLRGDLNLKGGVVSYYRSVEPHLEDVESFIISRRKNEYRLFTPFRLIYDYSRFIIRLLIKRPQLVHLNPSLNFNSVWREAIFILIAKLLRIPVLVFFRGWKEDFFEKSSMFSNWVFNRIYGLTDRFIVLAEKFEKDLEKRFPGIPIEIETTAVDVNLVKDIELIESDQRMERLTKKSKKVFDLSETVQ